MRAAHLNNRGLGALVRDFEDVAEYDARHTARVPLHEQRHVFARALGHALDTLPVRAMDDLDFWYTRNGLHGLLEFIHLTTCTCSAQPIG